MTERVREGEAHVWTVPLDAAPIELEAAGQLSVAEREKSSRIVDPAMRRRFIVTRVAQRALLGACTGTAPSRLELRRSEQGKPFLAARVGIDFSLSHSRGVALVAVARAATGVDIEHVRRPLHLDRTARRILHEDTVALLERLEGDALVRAFIAAWTLREAHVKAVGGGLFRTPDVLPFDATAPSDGTCAVLRGRDGTMWSVARFEPGEETHAAIVVAGEIGALHVHDAAATVDFIREALDVG